MNWVSKLRKLNKENFICVGIDPIMNSISNLGIDLFGWCKLIIDSTAKDADAFKFQLAYFEENGVDGLEKLKKSIEYIKINYPEKIIIGDSKRSDIGSTARAYARSMYEYWGFDVSTINPYFGSDSIHPFAEMNGALVICKSSNESSNELQSLETKDSKFVYEKVLEIVKKCNKDNNLGIVVGATYPDELKKIRLNNLDIPILIPGLGFQGGDFKSTIQAGKGGLNILNSSRGICFPKESFESLLDYEKCVTEALLKFKKNIKEFD